MTLTIACGFTLFFFVLAQVQNAKAMYFQKVNVRLWVLSLVGFLVSILCTVFISATHV
jgi:hypothetical protein